MWGLLRIPKTPASRLPVTTFVTIFVIMILLMAHLHGALLICLLSFLAFSFDALLIDAILLYQHRQTLATTSNNMITQLLLPKASLGLSLILLVGLMIGMWLLNWSFLVGSKSLGLNLFVSVFLNGMNLGLIWSWWKQYRIRHRSTN